LSHNGASDAQASVYLWVGVAIGVYVRAQVCKPVDVTPNILRKECISTAEIACGLAVDWYQLQ